MMEGYVRLSTQVNEILLMRGINPYINTYKYDVSIFPIFLQNWLNIVIWSNKSWIYGCLGAGIRS